MPFHKVIFILVPLLIISETNGKEPNKSLAIELENTLAKEFVKNIIFGYPREDPSNRKSYLEEKQKEYRNRVDIIIFKKFFSL